VANRAREIALSSATRAELERLIAAFTAPAALSRRARAVLLMAEGLPRRAIALRTSYTPVQISRIRARFAMEGVTGLADRPRSGRPSRITAAKRARIIALTLQNPPRGLSRWSTREMAARVGVSAATVHRIWQAHALQPHRTQTFK
jgi:transposase